MKGISISVRAASLGDDLRDVLPAAQRMGFAGVQLEALSSTLDCLCLSNTGQREVRHLLAQFDQRLVALRTQLPLGLTADLDKTLWHLTRAIQAAADLQAQMLCINVGPIPPVPPTHAPRPSISARQAGMILLPGDMDIPMPPEPPADPAELAQWPAVEQALAEIGKLADRYNLHLALSSELSALPSLHRAVSTAACPWIGIDLDPVAILRDRWDLTKVISEAGSLLLHIRGRDALKGSGGRTQPTAVGRGTTDWQHLLDLLDEGAFRGWISIDTLDLPDRVAHARKAADYLRMIVER